MLQHILAALAIVVLIDSSIWIFGRGFMELDSGYEGPTSYLGFVKKRSLILASFFFATYVVASPGLRSIYIRIGLLIIVTMAYLIVSFKELRKSTNRKN